MGQAHFQGSFKKGKYTINVGLSIYMWEEDGIFYVFSPALDLTGYGTSELDAKGSFETTLSEFLKYTNNKNTIFDELEHLGWTVNRKKKRIHAPDLEEMLSDNESFKQVIKKGGLRTENRSVELALV